MSARALTGWPALLSAAVLTAGCSLGASSGEQRIAVCGAAPQGLGSGEMLAIEFRQGDRVVGQGGVSPGAAWVGTLPVGKTRVYLDGVLVGEADGQRVKGNHKSVGSYLSVPGCPEIATQ